VNENGLSGKLTIVRPSEATWTTFSFTGQYVNQSGVPTAVMSGGQRSETALVDAIQVLPESGLLESGILKLYGVN